MRRVVRVLRSVRIERRVLADVDVLDFDPAAFFAGARFAGFFAAT